MYAVPDVVTLSVQGSAIVGQETTPSERVSREVRSNAKRVPSSAQR
jgi:hypothetical protein